MGHRSGPANTSKLPAHSAALQDLLQEATSNMADLEPIWKARLDYHCLCKESMLLNVCDLVLRTEKEKDNPTGLHPCEERAPIPDKGFSA